MKFDDPRFLDYILKAGLGFLLGLLIWHCLTYYTHIMGAICY